MGEKTAAAQRVQEPNRGPKVVKFESLVDRIDSICHEVARRAYQLFEGGGRQEGHDVEHWLAAESELLCPVDIQLKETDKALEITAEVPGFNETELEISVEPRQLTITGKRETNTAGKKGGIVYSEARATDILRIIPLPTEVDAAHVTATVANGILSITVPKAGKAETVHVHAKAV